MTWRIRRCRISSPSPLQNHNLHERSGAEQGARGSAAGGLLWHGSACRWYGRSHDQLKNGNRPGRCTTSEIHRCRARIIGRQEVGLRRHTAHASTSRRFSPTSEHGLVNRRAGPAHQQAGRPRRPVSWRFPRHRRLRRVSRVGSHRIHVAAAQYVEPSIGDPPVLHGRGRRRGLSRHTIDVAERGPGEV